ncbi:hypothetical protein GH714_009919 [Hevea brasiliensis]|uniref:Uncharacterized protein n=1 Tax=Hevea brasiliensis TaxID=3981 RepID=A0A6A6LFD6_HEVBR|nr:hypothetical protein GH714_009919 [Hevea brasiliensis]
MWILSYSGQNLLRLESGVKQRTNTFLGLGIELFTYLIIEFLETKRVLDANVMALAFIYSLQNLWPLSIFKFDDLRASNGLVSKLSIPENIKRFVYAVRDPESQSVIYILSVQNLSERSAIDAECLIREIRPEAVVVQVSSSALCQIQSEEGELGNNIEEPVPTSFFGVIKRCFIDKISKDKYENVAGKLVLKEIFGIGFYGHIMAAKRVAREVGSSFLLLETPLVQTSVVDDSSSEVDTESVVRGLVSSLIPQKLGSAVSSSSGKFCLTDEIHFQMVKLLSPYMEVSMQKLRPSSSVSEAGSKEIHPGSSYLLPPFAQSVYPLLSDLHDIFIDLPSIGRALASSQKMLLWCPPIGFLPWATFGCSIATCSALLMYGDGIECAAESVPAAPSIASLGRGIQNLHQVSQEVEQKDGTRIQKAIESLMYSLRKVKIQ